MTFKNMVEIIPPGVRGAARIEHVTVSPSASAFTQIRAMIHPEAYVSAGTYCHLRVGSELMMSDTGMERRTNYQVVHRATGKVLIAGLGIGMILVPILAKRNVTEVTVVEKYRDVIDLVEAPLRALPGGEKLKIVEADIFTWDPPKGDRWDTIYFDIWPTLSTDTLQQMEKLHRKFGRRKTDFGWMGSWRHADLLLRRRAQAKRPGPW